jgi:hypothetical protein
MNTNLPTLKEGYARFTMNVHFVTKKSFFFFWMLIPMKKYSEFKKEFQGTGKVIDWSVGMVEKPKMFGASFIGLPDPKGDLLIEGDFVAYKMVGDYRQFKKVWKKIMTDYPNIKEAYHLYQTNPDVTKMEENVTLIIFR